LAEVSGIEVVVVNVDFPMKDETQLLTAVQAAYEENPDIKLSIFSHISSMPAVIEPVVELTKLARNINSMVLIDGAHAPGVVSIDINAISPDFYLGNCHKWLFAPKGTAFLWVRKEMQLTSFPEPTVISSSGKPDYVGIYEYTGTRDYTGFSALPAALSFVETLGGFSKMYDYNRVLAVQAGRTLAAAWKTQLLVPESMTAFMFNVVLPTNDANAAAYMQAKLDSDYNIYLVYTSVTDSQGNTILYTRLSSQVYLELRDFEQLKELVPKLLTEYNSTTVDKKNAVVEPAMMGIV